jgi:hypothetical protein
MYANVHLVWISDKGSHAQCARVQIQGMPIYGIVDSGADIIIGGGLFRKIAAAAKLRET